MWHSRKCLFDFVAFLSAGIGASMAVLWAWSWGKQLCQGDCGVAQSCALAARPSPEISCVPAREAKELCS